MAGEFRNPALTVDVIIEMPGGGIVLVERRNEPHGHALPGGFVDYGETLEHAAVREVREETGLDVVLRGQLHAYSDPSRDARQHTVSVVFVGRAEGQSVAGDDAAAAAIYSLDQLPPLVFDHSSIIEDFISGRYGIAPADR